ncbi:MAG TPA: hypothetical protein PKJ33_04065 [Alphaproteobacteria bacterium]|nr:hypothetical protein [Alphaproteobacteria bacterium]
MKTKIIYISGSEVFDVADIRSAFEEVRNALQLGTDTILFGVPVDSDDAGLGVQKNTNVNNQVIETIPEEIIEPEVIVEQLPKKKATKSAKLKTEPEEITQKTEESEKIIPILSVLSSKKEPEEIVEEVISDTIPEAVIAVSDPEPAIIVSEVPEVKPIMQSEQVITVESDFSTQLTEEVISTKTTIIEEMMVDDIPVVEQEKTLEQLFERIAPLREDHIFEEIVEKPTVQKIEEVNLDATLEQLASEFAQKQDSIPVNSKTEASGKIGKLKNILPFKKAKREEPSLMGDLFGWAGIAANDDEFSIPGFFTTSASKK